MAARHRKSQPRADQQPSGDAIAQTRMGDEQGAQAPGEDRPQAVAHDRHREERHCEQQELLAGIGAWRDELREERAIEQQGFGNW